MAKCSIDRKTISTHSEQPCNHIWAEAFCISEDFTRIEPNGEECENCGEKRGQVI
jgi:hypothetical protein